MSACLRPCGGFVFAWTMRLTLMVIMGTFKIDLITFRSPYLLQRRHLAASGSINFLRPKCSHLLC